MKRRSFFKSLATFVATIALAPEIAFKVSPLKERPFVPVPVEWKAVPFWYQTSRVAACYNDDYRKWMELVMKAQG